VASEVLRLVQPFSQLEAAEQQWALQVQGLPVLRSDLCNQVAKAVQAGAPESASRLLRTLAQLACGGMPLALQHLRDMRLPQLVAALPPLQGMGGQAAEDVLRIHWLAAQLLQLHSFSLLSDAAEQQLQGCSPAALEAWQLYGGAVATSIQVRWG
jgi:hypothetical protein